MTNSMCKFHQLVSAAVGGFSMPMSEVYGGETWIELKSGGRGTIMLGGDDFSMKWTLEGEELTVTVQGVFDCVFEDGDGRLVLLDYKTDYMTAEELQSPELGRDKLRRRHSLQLSYYAKAVELLFGRAPDEVYVYSLPLGEGVPMEAGV